MVTPLQPREFFPGHWEGQGRIIPHPLLRWFLRPEPFDYSCDSIPLSETIWLVKDRLEFASGRVLQWHFYSELIAPDRLHVTGDYMPGGADMLLRADGFHYTPYRWIACHRGLTVTLRCLDEISVDGQGRMHDQIRLFWFGFPAAKICIGPIAKQTTTEAKALSTLG